MSNTLETRLELLKLEGFGFSQIEIVKELSRKYQVSERSVYYDFEMRSKWNRYDDEETILKILNRFEQLAKNNKERNSATHNQIFILIMALHQPTPSKLPIKKRIMENSI